MLIVNFVVFLIKFGIFVVFVEEVIKSVFNIYGII